MPIVDPFDKSSSGIVDPFDTPVAVETLPTMPSKPYKRGFLSRVGGDISKRYQNVKSEYTPQGDESFGDTVLKAPERVLRAAGQVAGAIQDVAGEGIKSAYETIAPDKAQEAIKGAGKAILDTAVGKMGMDALRQGQAAWNLFSRSYPNAAKDIEAVVNIASILPMSKLPQVAGTAAKEGVAIAGDVANLARSGITGKAAERLYGSATKMPLGKKWTQVLPGQEVADRTKAIRAGIEQRVMPTEQGLAKATALEEGARKAVDDVINNFAKQGKTIKRDDLIKGLDKAYAVAESSSKPEVAKAALDRLKSEFSKRPGTIPVDEVQKIKRQFYKEANYGVAPPRSVAAQFNEMGTKGIAHEAMAQLERMYPELKAMNQADAAYIKLKEGIERAVGRMGNRDIIGLGEGVAATAGAAVSGGLGAAVGFALKRLVDMPTVKARLAFALDKARLKGGFTPKSKIGQAIKDFNTIPQWKKPTGTPQIPYEPFTTQGKPYTPYPAPNMPPGLPGRPNVPMLENAPTFEMKGTPQDFTTQGAPYFGQRDVTKQLPGESRAQIGYEGSYGGPKKSYTPISGDTSLPGKIQTGDPLLDAKIKIAAETPPALRSAEQKLLIDWIQRMTPRAEGGPIQPGKQYLVGEKGVETMVTPPKPLTREQALEYLDKAGGNINKARNMAKKDGYKFNE